MTGGTWKHAPGFYVGDRPQIVTSRFQYEDSYTLERYLALMDIRDCVPHSLVLQMKSMMKSGAPLFLVEGVLVSLQVLNGG